MWNVNANNIQMCEGDFGVRLPITITGPTFSTADTVKLTIKTAVNGDTILEKDFSDISQNTVNLILTATESALLPVGNYVYCLDWYQSGQFLCNIIPTAFYKVVDKA